MDTVKNNTVHSQSTTKAKLGWKKADTFGYLVFSVLLLAQVPCSYQSTQVLVA